MEKSTRLHRLYYRPGEVGAFRGPKALFQAARRHGHKDISFQDCKDFLATQPTYSLYRPRRLNFRRNKIRATYPGDVVQIDIMDMQKFKSSNKYIYVLLAYDTYSKFLQGVPLKNREAPGVLQGLKTFLRGPIGFSAIYWDKEGSFLSRKIQRFLKDAGIHNYTTKSVVKAPGVERSIRTIRTAVQRYFDSTETQKWEAFLPKFIHSYNHRRHSTTKHKPIDLVNDPTIILDTKPQPRRKVKLPPIGSYVRLSRLRGIFEKEASGTWTKEIFRVIRHVTHQPIPMIRVESLDGDPVLGSLYPEEYQPIRFSRPVARVYKVRNDHEFLVSYPGSHAKVWINENKP